MGGGEPAQLTDIDYGSDKNPSFSADGNIMVFERNGQVWKLDRTTGNVSALTGYGHATPCVSPDGTKIVYENGEYIWIMDINGQNRIQLSFVDDYTPKFSADGTKIVYEQDGNIIMMNPDGSGKTTITNTANDLEPAMSPDGNRVVFMSERDGNQEIYVINTNGTGLTRLTNDSARDFAPVFSPDGYSIAFVTTRDGTYNIYTMGADGTNQTRITFEGQNVSPWWQSGEINPVQGNQPPVVAITDINGDWENDAKKYQQRDFLSSHLIFKTQDFVSLQFSTQLLHLTRPVWSRYTLTCSN